MTASIASLDLIGSQIQASKNEILDLHEKKIDPFEVLSARAALMDRLLVSLYREVEGLRLPEGKEKMRAVLLAQGGYGRSELCLHSDIDLLLIYEGESGGFVRLLTEKVLQNLWDAGLEVGLATRTIRDCRQLMEKDITILTSVIDRRYLAGDEKLWEEFDRMVSKYFSSDKNQKKLFESKKSESKEREERYGDSVYLLEPNLKEGKGGLRDYHTLYWLAKVRDRIKDPQDLKSCRYLTEEEFKSYWQALSFLWQVRNELHRRTGRRQDQILFEHQEPIAQWLGYQNDEHFLGVELFMQHYYTQAARLHNLTEKALKRFELDQKHEPMLFAARRDLEDAHFYVRNGRLLPDSPELFEKDPLYLLKVFELKRKYQLTLDDVTKERIEKSLSMMDDRFRESAEAGALFRDMLRQPLGLGEMFFQMNDLGVLGAFLPEFQKLHFRAQHDVYHVYTVDVHSIFAVCELGKLLQGDYAKTHPTLSQLVCDIERKDVLSFAIFYHDIGKGEGKGHVEKGAPLIRKAGKRLGFSEADVDILEFLERSHLIMTHLAFRRDLEDQNLIIQFARSMQDSLKGREGAVDLLNMLYVLTFCDVKGVSQEAMTDWKASLIEYLYLKTREVLQKGTFTKEKVSVLIPKVRDEVRVLLETEEDQKKCLEFFSMMPPRYLLATPPGMIVRHVKLWEKFAEDPIVFEARVLEKEGLNEVTLLTWAGPALFAEVAGIFAAYNINILEAQLNLSTKGQALHIFKVTDPEGRPLADQEKWARVEKDLREVLEGRVPIEKLVAEKFRPQLLKKKLARILPSRVDVDNDVSAYYTVIDITTHDRVGLLYQITSTLAALGLYVDVSKISTKVDQVADTFYVKDIFGHKITSLERIQKIRTALNKVLEEEPTPGWKPLAPGVDK